GVRLSQGRAGGPEQEEPPGALLHFLQDRAHEGDARETLLPIRERDLLFDRLDLVVHGEAGSWPDSHPRPGGTTPQVFDPAAPRARASEGPTRAARNLEGPWGSLADGAVFARVGAPLPALYL